MKKISNKSSWRLFVILPIVVFALIMTLMVVISMTRKVDLVTDNYYEQELKYQQQIDLKKNSVDLNNLIKTQAEGNSVILYSDDPGTLSGKSGEIIFYRPSDAAMDFKVVFKADPNGKQIITHPALQKGLWKIRLNLSEDGINYAVDKSVFIN